MNEIKNVLCIEDIRKAFESGMYTAAKAEGPDQKLPDNYIFDEDLSVRKNREMVAAHNQKVAELKALRQKNQALLNKKLTDDVVAYIVEYYDLTDYQARLVESWVYTEKHSFMCDYFSSIDSVAELASNLVNKCE